MVSIKHEAQDSHLGHMATPEPAPLTGEGCGMWMKALEKLASGPLS